jgi:hypothetical protein
MILGRPERERGKKASEEKRRRGRYDRQMKITNSQGSRGRIRKEERERERERESLCICLIKECSK